MAIVENSPRNSTAGMNQNGLPTIQDLPGADVVIYDGDCNFCRKQVQRLHWFAQGKLAFISLHDPRVKEICPNLSHQQLMKQMYVITSDFDQYGGAAAVRYLSTRLPRLWLVAPLMYIPFSLPLWQYLYDWVARWRYSIAGKAEPCEGGSCDVHFKK